jgi:putative DNA primase/helicase
VTFVQTASQVALFLNDHSTQQTAITVTHAKLTQTITATTSQRNSNHKAPTMTAKYPLVNEFIKFINLLTKNAPENYSPYLIRLNPGGKDPIEGISWKSPEGKLTIAQAIDYMKHGGNIGIAATTDDDLVNMDCDGGIIQENEAKKTLMVTTRSRIGKHGFYWNIDQPKIPNIPTDEAGEVRSQWQFVVCAGSYVETDPAKVPEAERENTGYYTICNAQAPTTLTYSELPNIFREVHERVKTAPVREPSTFDPKKATGKHSALFDITATDVCLREGAKTTQGKRWSSLFHDSDTGKNMSLSNEGLLQCWRHNCSFNGLQALVVLSGYMSCNDAGSHHKGTGGNSRIVGDDGAIFYAWKYAKEHGYIPKNDPIPVRALNYIADKHLKYKAEKDKPLPINVYKLVLKIVAEEY